jgi:DNA-directed RNA polymerase sigma subunit (sigma70/sigma32)
MRTPENQRYMENGKLFDGFGVQIFPKKQNLSEEELNRQNIRGYAALIQEAFRLDTKEGLLRQNKDLNPFKTIEIDQTEARNLVEGVEVALNLIPPREQKAIRLYFGLDQLRDSEFITQEAVGKELKDSEGKKEITKARVGQIIEKAKRHLSDPYRAREISKRFPKHNSTI